MNRRRRRAVVFLLALVPSLAAAGDPSPEVPFLSGRVNDTAHLLSPDTRTALERLLKVHEDSTTNQIAVLTIESLQGAVLEEFAYSVATTWRLGRKGRDNGALLLVSRDDRKVRIEVGDGLEGFLTDATCGSIIRHEIVPRFKRGDYDGGVLAGVGAMIGAIGGAYTAEGDLSEAANGDDPLGFWEKMFVSGFFLLIVGLFTVIAVFSRGAQSWFLFFFLIPFWLAFPVAIHGFPAGITVFILYIVGFLGTRLWMRGTHGGQAFRRRVDKTSFFAGGSGGSGSWSSGGSSSGGGFSGGGGSFSGGGASGSW